MKTDLKATWMYYDYLRRFGIFILLGLAIGLTAGFLHYQAQSGQTEYVARGVMSAPTGAVFMVVSKGYADPRTAVESVVAIRNHFEGTSRSEESELVANRIIRFDGNVFSTVESRIQRVLWKDLMVGGVLGVLVAIGIVYVWNDVLTYWRRGKGGESDFQ